MTYKLTPTSVFLEENILALAYNLIDLDRHVQVMGAKLDQIISRCEVLPEGEDYLRWHQMGAEASRRYERMKEERATLVTKIQTHPLLWEQVLETKARLSIACTTVDQALREIQQATKGTEQ